MRLAPTRLARRLRPPTFLHSVRPTHPFRRFCSCETENNPRILRVILSEKSDEVHRSNSAKPQVQRGAPGPVPWRPTCIGPSPGLVRGAQTQSHVLCFTYFFSLKGAEILAKEEFDLDGPVQFETSDLAQCAGMRVQIRWDTWKTASLLSAQLFVKEVIFRGNAAPTPAGTCIPATPSASSDERLLLASHPASREPLHPPRSKRQSHQAKREPQDQQLSESHRDVEMQPDKSDQAFVPATRPPSPKPLTPASSTSSIKRSAPARSISQQPTRARALSPEIDVKAEVESDEDDDAPMESARDWSDVESEVNIKQEPEDDDFWLKNDAVKSEGELVPVLSLSQGRGVF